MKRSFSIEQDREIARLYQEGLSSIKLAQRYGVDKSTILGALKRQGVKRRRSNQETTSQDKINGMKPYGNQLLTRSEAEQAYIIYKFGGFSLNRISQTYGFGKNGRGLSEAFKRYGLETRGRKALTLEQEKEIAKLYDSGLSAPQIAKRFNLERSCISRAVKRQGVKFRKQTATFKHNLDIHIFDKLDTEEKAYWAGFIYADGCVTNDKIFSIGISTRDEVHLVRLKNFLKASHPLYYRSSSGFQSVRQMVYLHINHHHMAKALQNLGIVKDRVSFHLLEKSLPNNLCRHFIRGYLDGDGCVRGAYNPSVTFIGQYDLLSWIREVFHKNLDTKPDMAIPKSKGKEIYTINYTGPRQAKKIINWLYEGATVWLERKKAKADSWK